MASGKTKARVVTAWLADELVSLAQAGDDKLSLVTRCVLLGGCDGGFSGGFTSELARALMYWNSILCTV